MECTTIFGSYSAILSSKSEESTLARDESHQTERIPTCPRLAAHFGNTLNPAVPSRQVGQYGCKAHRVWAWVFETRSHSVALTGQELAM